MELTQTATSKNRSSLSQTKIPFYSREIASFDDAVLVKSRKSNDDKGYVAFIDLGPELNKHDMKAHYYTFGKTEAEAIELCAQKIKTEGKDRFLPERLAEFGLNYDFRLKLFNHWTAKEAALLDQVKSNSLDRDGDLSYQPQKQRMAM